MTLENYNEPDVLRKLIEGDAGAFRSIYEHYQGKVFGFAYYLTKSKDIAEEIVQEVFIKLWEKRGQIDTGKNFNNYIRKITQNHVLNYFRDVTKNTELFDKFYEHLTELRNTPVESLLQKELNIAYADAVNQLTPAQKIVYLLRRDEELSYNEIAEKLGVSPNTVRNQLADANKFIRDQIRKNPGLTSLILLLYYAKDLKN